MTRVTRTSVSLAALAVATVATASPALAQDWNPVAPGVEYATWVDAMGSRVYVSKIDLCAPGISMRATAPGEGPRTVSSFGQMVGAAAAINGDWWSNDGEPQLPSTYPRGLSMGNGKHFEGTVDRPNYGVVAFGPSIAMHSIQEEDLGGPHFWMQNVVSGQPTLIWNGQLRDNPNAHCGVRRARTAVGFDEAMRTMWLTVVQEVGGSTGKTCNEMAALVKSLGAFSALNQDGGGSSTMWIQDRGVVNSPSDGRQRSLVNHWGVQASGWGPPHSCASRDIPDPSVGQRRLVSAEAMAGWGFEGSDVSFMAPESFDAYPEAAPLEIDPRYVQRGDDSSLWLVSQEVRRRVQTFYAIATWRIRTEDVISGGDAELDELADGPPISETPILVLGPDLTVWLIDTAPEQSGDGDGDGDGDGGDGDGDGDGSGEDGDVSVGCAAGSSGRGGSLWLLAFALAAGLFTTRARAAS